MQCTLCIRSGAQVMTQYENVDSPLCLVGVPSTGVALPTGIKVAMGVAWEAHQGDARPRPTCHQRRQQPFPYEVVLNHVPARGTARMSIEMGAGSRAWVSQVVEAVGYGSGVLWGNSTGLHQGYRGHNHDGLDKHCALSFLAVCPSLRRVRMAHV